MQLIHQNGDRLFVTTLEISNRFGKRHDDVLKAVRNLECSPEFRLRNFAESVYHNSQNKAQPLFEITRDGFTFLCMGFTGPQAALWKERYIEAFNRMETALRATPPSALDLKRLSETVYDQQRDLAGLGQALRLQAEQIATQNAMLLGLYQQLDGARRGHLRCLTSLANAQKRQAAADAKALVLALEAQGVPREEIVRRTGKTFNHVRQIVFQARQRELALGDAA